MSATQRGRISFGYQVHLLMKADCRREGTVSKLEAMMFRRLLFICNDHPIPGGDKGNDPVEISCHIAREAVDGFGGGLMVVWVQDLSMPDHVVNDEDAAMTK